MFAINGEIGVECQYCVAFVKFRHPCDTGVGERALPRRSFENEAQSFLDQILKAAPALCRLRVGPAIEFV